jgi:asparagine synthetase B (glutamine-hydrolysing)
MCGIFGVLVSTGREIEPKTMRAMIKHLHIFSESRGKEASGVAALSEEAITVFKQPIPASRMVKTPLYTKVISGDIGHGQPAGIRANAVIGHSRLVTNGSQERPENNQPVVKDGIVGVHNGIIVNADALWEKNPGLERKYEIDSEIIFGLLQHYLGLSGSLRGAVGRTFADLEGVAAIAALFDALDVVLLASNNGSLYMCRSQDQGLGFFSSERYILERFVKKQFGEKRLGEYEIFQVLPGCGCLVDLKALKLTTFEIGTAGAANDGPQERRKSRDIIDYTPDQPSAARSIQDVHFVVPTHIERHYLEIAPVIDSLRRCKKCVLPETMPFIRFDRQGICNYCTTYKKNTVAGTAELKRVLNTYRRDDGRPDCVIALSGGRDSSFGLHYLKTEMRMHPVAYTYDWGMVTDLARRNISRLCGKLGVEHILVSADIRKKRSNIRKNVTAWLRKPDLGTVPLFMAGDKQYFYYATQVRKQLGCGLIIMCENMLETTGFKSGFCGIPKTADDSHAYTISWFSKIRLAKYYLQQFITNPRYLNSSLLDSAGAYVSYYLQPHNYLNLYQFVPWEENAVTAPLLNGYNWETAPDTQSTWRIGDGTAAFYNYIYYTMAGFTENDTFRSNQIREGMISRERALQLVGNENRPRYDSIKWYCDIVGIDFTAALERINSAEAVYK